MRPAQPGSLNIELGTALPLFLIPVKRGTAGRAQTAAPDATHMQPHATIRIICAEHAALSAVLRTVSLLQSEHLRRDTLPDFAVLRAMLFYIDEFPERVHHPKESRLLFPQMRSRSGELAEVLDGLDGDHAWSQQAVRELQHELLGLEMMSDASDARSRREQFEGSLKHYIARYIEHMRTEESLVLPLAERVLTEADWNGLDAAFLQNRDPLSQCERDDDYRPLFKRILMTLGAPLSLGSAMEAMRVSYPSGGGAPAGFDDDR